MVFTILAGGYDTFIATYSFDPSAASLNITGRYPSGSNPSWLTGHPTNSSIFYAVNELSQGALQSYVTTKDGVVTGPFGTVSSGGDSPAFAVALGTGEVAVMNYGGGNGRLIHTLSENPLSFDDSAPVITFPPPAGGVSHPHEAVANGDEVFIPDLGADQIWRVTKSSSGAPQISGSIPQPKGSGPRHIAIRDSRVFALHELASTLTIQKIPKLAINASAPLIANVSIIPANTPAGSSWGAAEILYPEPTSKFPKSYIYVSNRNIATDPAALDPRGDTIAIFEHVGKDTAHEGLRLVKQVFTGLSQVRGMEIGPVSNGGEEYLIAAGVAGTAGTVVLKRINQGADLQVVARNTEIQTRTSFLWL